MLRQKYVAGTHCHPICSDNYILYKVIKVLGNDYKMVERYLAN